MIIQLVSSPPAVAAYDMPRVASINDPMVSILSAFGDDDTSFGFADACGGALIDLGC